jgi:hypothetical protein
MWGAVGSVVFSFYWAFLRSEPHGTHEHILLSLFLILPQPVRPDSCIYFSQEQGSSVTPPGIGFVWLIYILFQEISIVHICTIHNIRPLTRAHTADYALMVICLTTDKFKSLTFLCLIKQRTTLHSHNAVTISLAANLHQQRCKCNGHTNTTG